MPRGFRTLVGPRPDWARQFGLSEHRSDKYPPRTYENVRLADITIRVAVDFASSGERCTMGAIERYGRPYCDVQVRRVARGYCVDEELVFAAADKIRELAAAIGLPAFVNFAGNSERAAPGIEAFAEGVVKMILDKANESPPEVHR